MVIMVIDDDEGIVDALSAAIELHGDTVLAVKDPKETMRYCEYQKPDLIFLDLLLSGMNGTDAIVMLRDSDITRHVPVIMMSAHPTAFQSAKDAKATAFLPKPFSLEQIFALIEEYSPSTKEM